jgi:hypothetical protein
MYMDSWLKSEELTGDDDLNHDWEVVASRSRNHQKSRLKDDGAAALNEAMRNIVWIHASGKGKVFRCKACAKWGHEEDGCRTESYNRHGIRAVRIELPYFQQVHSRQHFMLMCC